MSLRLNPKRCQKRQHIIGAFLQSQHPQPNKKRPKSFLLTTHRIQKKRNPSRQERDIHKKLLKVSNKQAQSLQAISQCKQNTKDSVRLNSSKAHHKSIQKRSIVRPVSLEQII